MYEVGLRVGDYRAIMRRPRDNCTLNLIFYGGTCASARLCSWVCEINVCVGGRGNLQSDGREGLMRAAGVRGFGIRCGLFKLLFGWSEYPFY